MTKIDITNKVLEILENHLGVKINNTKANIQDDLGADSLDSVEIIMALEETFNISKLFWPKFSIYFILFKERMYMSIFAVMSSRKACNFSYWTIRSSWLRRRHSSVLR